MSVQVTDARADDARLQQDAREHLLLHLARKCAYDDPQNELLILDRAEGVRVYDTAGREYIDALSCLFCAQIGYSYGDEMADAAAEQLRRMPFNTHWNGVLENVRKLEPTLRGRLDELRALPAVGDVRGDGFFGRSSSSTPRATRWTRRPARISRGYLPRRMRELGLIARAHDRAARHWCRSRRPLVCDRETLDTIVDRLGELLEGAGDRLREVA